MRIKGKYPLFLVLVLGLAAVSGIGLAADDPPLSDIFLPLIEHQPPPPTLLDAWVTDQTGIRSETYSPGETVEYHLSGHNPSNPMIEVLFQWNQTGDCGETRLYDELLTLPAGDWEYQYTGVTLNCLGTYANTVTISYTDKTSTHTTEFEVVDTSSQIIISKTHGFEKCGLPSLDQMAIWKQESPYDVFNIYLGGDHFACNLLIDADWVRATAGQGWDFILTWTGHGTSCWEAGKTNYHPISSDPDEAYQEGRAAAAEAIGAARNLGFLGQKVIYYDVEGYSDIDPSCRPAMEAFLEGWAARLHENGDKAGAYGSPCRSYIMDWEDNDPTLDDIWFARWSYDGYHVNATVWDDPGVSCALPNDVWENDQRIRQYAGDHSETWPECPDDKCTTINSITSNVLEGEITRLLSGE